MAKAIKGFSTCSVFPVNTNTALSYVVGDKLSVPGARSFVLDPIVSEYKQYADDVIYNQGSDVSGYNYTFEIAEITPAIEAFFEGGTLDAVTGEYTFKTTDDQPEFAMSFKCLQADGDYKMVKLFNLKAQALSFNAKTKDETTELQSVTVKGIVSERLIDNALKTQKVSTSEADYTWLDTITYTDS